LGDDEAATTNIVKSTDPPPPNPTFTGSKQYTMKQVAILLVLCCGTALAAYFSIFHAQRPPDSGFPPNWLDWDTIARRSEKLDQEARNRKFLWECMDARATELRRGAISLKDACRAAHEDAREFAPELLGHMQRAFPTNTRKELMAQTIIYRLRLMIQTRLAPDVSALIESLQSESASASFQDWCRQDWAVE
jgi:hypothetical protein